MFYREKLKDKINKPRLGIYSYTPEPHIALCHFFHPFFPVFDPSPRLGLLCPSSPFDLPKCLTIITVRVCVKASRAEGLTSPNVKNDAGQTVQSVFLRRRRRPKASDAFTRTLLVPTFGVSAERPAEGPKVVVR